MITLPARVTSTDRESRPIVESKITVLPEEVASKIAAGEVIERPSSIVKELLENALDAGATDITIELHGGGKERIRIVDNGAGIAPEDVTLAFERHATSKILTVADLYDVRFFGFRGEALPSIAAVSRVEMATRRRGDVAGTHMVVENGRILENEAVGCPEGTSITVSRLFDSLPVRKKFLRQDATEQGRCLDVLVRVLLPHGRVRARAASGARTLLEIPRTENLRERIVLLLGNDLRNHLVPVETESPGMRLRGFLSKPDFTRSSARNMFFYINSRYVRDVFLSQAVMSAYRNLLDARKYPACVLFLDLPPAMIDVNVHPAKLEVRFRRPQEIRELLQRGLAGVLSGVRPTVQTAPVVAGTGRPTVSGRTGVYADLRRYSLSAGMAFREPLQETAGARYDIFDRVPDGKDLFPPTAGEKKPLSFSTLDYLGQVEQTYLVFSAPGVMILLDQHAAHERILYERLRRSTDGNLEVQSLLIPEILEMNLRDFHLLLASRDLLRQAGVEIEVFGEKTVVVKTVPALLGQADVKALIREILDGIADSGLPESEKRDRMLIGMACRGAIKANQALTADEVKHLCRDLDSIPYASNCPHGRPIFVELPAAVLARMFRRT